MATLGDMKARIASEIMDDEITAQIANAIADAIKFYESKAFYFNSRLASFNTVSGREWYDAADHADIPNLVTIRSMKVGASGVRDDLTVYDPDVLESMQDGGTTGEPYGFAYDEQKIRFIGIPDAIYPVRARWVYRLAALGDDSASNAWTNDAELLIRNRAKSLLGTDVLEDDEMAQRCGLREKEALRALTNETRRRRSNGILRTEVASLVGGQTFDIRRGR